MNHTAPSRVKGPEPSLKYKEGQILLGARNGLFLFNDNTAGGSLAVQDPAIATGEVMSLVRMERGDGTPFILVGAGQGLFALRDKSIPMVVQEADPSITSYVFDIRKVSKRQALIFAGNGVFS